MPRAPSTLRFLDEARADLSDIQAHNPDHAERVLEKIHDWQEKITWGRVPQDHLTYLSGSDRTTSTANASERVGTGSSTRSVTTS